jgi:serine/threonine protein kinase
MGQLCRGLHNATCIVFTCLMPNEPPIALGDYRTLKTLGKGAFAKVKLAVHIETGEKVTQLKKGSYQNH